MNNTTIEWLREHGRNPVVQLAGALLLLASTGWENVEKGKTAEEVDQSAKNSVSQNNSSQSKKKVTIRHDLYAEGLPKKMTPDVGSLLYTTVDGTRVIAGLREYYAHQERTQIFIGEKVARVMMHGKGDPYMWRTPILQRDHPGCSFGVDWMYVPVEPEGLANASSQEIENHRKAMAWVKNAEILIIESCHPDPTDMIKEFPNARYIIAVDPGYNGIVGDLARPTEGGRRHYSKRNYVQYNDSALSQVWIRLEDGTLENRGAYVSERIPGDVNDEGSSVEDIEFYQFGKAMMLRMVSKALVSPENQAGLGGEKLTEKILEQRPWMRGLCEREGVFIGPKEWEKRASRILARYAAIYEAREKAGLEKTRSDQGLKMPPETTKFSGPESRRYTDRKISTTDFKLLKWAKSSKIRWLYRRVKDYVRQKYPESQDTMQDPLFYAKPPDWSAKAKYNIRNSDDGIDAETIAYAVRDPKLLTEHYFEHCKTGLFITMKDRGLSEEEDKKYGDDSERLHHDLYLATAESMIVTAPSQLQPVVAAILAQYLEKKGKHSREDIQGMLDRVKSRTGGRVDIVPPQLPPFGESYLNLPKPPPPPLTPSQEETWRKIRSIMRYRGLPEEPSKPKYNTPPQVLPSVEGDVLLQGSAGVYQQGRR